MSKFIFPLTILTIVQFCIVPCFAQTAQEINNLLNKSKLVDTGRQVNSRVQEGEVTISTFAHPKASNQDIKITALFMMKEIRQHYKKVLHINVLFYDAGNASHYREVEVREGDVLLVDSGRPVSEVLAQIGVSEHKVEAKNSAATTLSTSVTPQGSIRAQLHPPVAGGSLLQTVNSILPGVLSTSDELAWFESPDGMVRFLAPKTWIMDNSGLGGDLMTFATLRNGAPVTLHLGRQSLPQTIDQIADLHEQDARKKYGNVKMFRRKQTCSGLPAVYAMGTGVIPGNPATMVERDLLVKKRNVLYFIFLQSTAAADVGLDDMFQKIVDSAIIK